MGMEALRRITDLFNEGSELVIREEPPILIWVNKLNSFETDEARQDGAVARARLILALKEIGTPEKTLYEASLEGMSAADMREALTTARGNEFFLAATNEMRVDAEWRERVAMIERDEVLETKTDAERELMVKTNTDYLVELQARGDAKRAEYDRELSALSDADLRLKHREAWLDYQGMAAFTRDYQQTQVFFSLRTCGSSKKNEHDAWDHGGCDHSQRLCADRVDVKTIPQELIDRVLSSLRMQSMAVNDAAFSAGAASSSASSQRPSSEAASVDSTQAAPSPEPPTS